MSYYYLCQFMSEVTLILSQDAHTTTIIVPNTFIDRIIFVDSGIPPCADDLKYNFDRKYTLLAGWAGVEMTWYLPSTAYLKTGTSGT